MSDTWDFSLNHVIYTPTTYAWTKHYTKVMSWIPDTYKCFLYVALTWSDLNHRHDQNLYCLHQKQSADGQA